MSDDLGGNAARSVKHLGLGHATRLLVHAGGLLILSRLLSPAEFGYVAIATTLLAITETVRDLGLAAAAVRTPTLTAAQRDVLFWINTVVGVFIAVVIFSVSGLIADLFNEPRLEGVLQSVSLVPIINGLATQYRAGLQRELRFKAVATIDAIGAIVGLTAAVALALVGAGYWALVAQSLAIPFVALVGSVSVARWIPGWPHRGIGARALIQFGAHVSVSQVLLQVGNSLDTLAVGWTSTPSAVGAYNRAYQLAVVPFSQLRAPATMVATSVLSRIHDDASRLLRFVRHGQSGLLIMTLPIVAVILATPEAVVRLVLGPQWLAAAPLVAILAVGATMQVFAVVANWLFVASGSGSALSSYSMVSLALKAGGVLGLAWAGPIGVAIGLAGALTIAAPIALVWSSRRAHVPVMPLIANAVQLTMVAAVASTAAYFARMFVGSDTALLSVIVASAAVAAVFGLAAIVPTIRGEYGAVLRMIRKSLK